MGEKEKVLTPKVLTCSRQFLTQEGLCIGNAIALPFSRCGTLFRDIHTASETSNSTLCSLLEMTSFDALSLSVASTAYSLRVCGCAKRNCDLWLDDSSPAGSHFMGLCKNLAWCWPTEKMKPSYVYLQVTLETQVMNIRQSIHGDLLIGNKVILSFLLYCTLTPPPLPRERDREMEGRKEMDRQTFIILSIN